MRESKHNIKDQNNQTISKNIQLNNRLSMSHINNLSSKELVNILTELTKCQKAMQDNIDQYKNTKIKEHNKYDILIKQQNNKIGSSKNNDQKYKAQNKHNINQKVTDQSEYQNKIKECCTSIINKQVVIVDSINKEEIKSQEIANPISSYNFLSNNNEELKINKNQDSLEQNMYQLQSTQNTNKCKYNAFKSQQKDKHEDSCQLLKQFTLLFKQNAYLKSKLNDNSCFKKDIDNENTEENIKHELIDIKQNKPVKKTASLFDNDKLNSIQSKESDKKFDNNYTTRLNKFLNNQKVQINNIIKKSYAFKKEHAKLSKAIPNLQQDVKEILDNTKQELKNTSQDKKSQKKYASSGDILNKYDRAFIIEKLLTNKNIINKLQEATYQAEKYNNFDYDTLFSKESENNYLDSIINENSNL